MTTRRRRRALGRRARLSRASNSAAMDAVVVDAARRRDRAVADMPEPPRAPECAAQSVALARRRATRLGHARTRGDARERCARASVERAREETRAREAARAAADDARARIVESVVVDDDGARRRSRRARDGARDGSARAMASVEDALAVGGDASTGVGARCWEDGGDAPEPPPPPPKKEVLREQFERTRAAEKAWPCAPARVVGDRAAKCAHVRETEACKGRLGSISRYGVCDEEAFGLQTMFFPVLGLVLVAIASTYALAVAAGTFFVPALEYTATMMKMSPEVAGVALLALGNGAPICTRRSPSSQKACRRI